MSSILQLIHGQKRDIGFPVRRLLPAATARTVGPFVFFDHMGPVQFDSGTTQGDVRPHPHIGLATVTYLFSGAMVHRDSLGVTQRIAPGDVNWMSAGRGIVHSERIPDDIRAAGMVVHGLQMWVALPMDEEQGEPGFHHYPASVLPQVEVDAAHLHILAGRSFGQTSPVRTASPTLYLAGRITSGGMLRLPADYSERAVYVVSGTVELDGQTLEAGTLAVLAPHGDSVLLARSDARFMLLGGEPIDGPRFVSWNFVASRKALIDTAKLAWRAQDRSLFPAIPGEVEWIPLPEQ